jgi:hypothetical protein
VALRDDQYTKRAATAGERCASHRGFLKIDSDMRHHQRPPATQDSTISVIAAKNRPKRAHRTPDG